MIVGINDALKAIAYALLVLFFVIGVMKTCGSFTELKRPEVAFKCFKQSQIIRSSEHILELLNNEKF